MRRAGCVPVPLFPSILGVEHSFGAGGIKQAGSIAAAFWSFAISLHLFNLLFRRYETPKLMSWTVVAFGWSFVLTLVFLGPVAMETPERGRFFGISGAWCWITHQYHAQQIMMQYFFVRRPRAGGSWSN